MRIAVLFDGAGLARLGLEQAGHDCTGFELDPRKHALGLHVGSGNTVLADVRDVDLAPFDAIWSSPPCQTHSRARTQGPVSGDYAEDFLAWSLSLARRYPRKRAVWVENVLPDTGRPYWATLYNAAQFTLEPLQSRNRIFGGRFRRPLLYRPYRCSMPGICPAITATEHKGCATDTRRASGFYGRKLTLDECAHHQGFVIPDEWFGVPNNISRAKWHENMYEAIGNGVPCYMAYEFGRLYS